MLDYLYPVDEHALFTDRDHRLGLLDLCGAELQQGRRKHLALLGLRRIGKTLILKEFILRWLQRPVADAPRSSRSMWTSNAWGCRRNRSPWSTSAPCCIGSLRRARAVGMSTPACRRCCGLRAHWATRVYWTWCWSWTPICASRSSRNAACWSCLQLPGSPRREQDVRFLICIDEFQDLGLLSNFPQVGDVLDIFRSVLQTQSAVAYVAAGSAISLMEGIFHQARSPLFVHFRSERVGPLGRGESEELRARRSPARSCPPTPPRPSMPGPTATRSMSMPSPSACAS